MLAGDTTEADAGSALALQRYGVKSIKKKLISIPLRKSRYNLK
jgi:hypothetical protein